MDSYTFGVVDPNASGVTAQLANGAALDTDISHVSQFTHSAFFALVLPGESPDLRGLTVQYRDGHRVPVDLADKQFVYGAC